MKSISMIIMSFCIALACGCVTKVQVESTKQWEGHYFNEKDARDAVSSIQSLDPGESIWILSNSTLKRLLRNVGK